MLRQRYSIHTSHCLDVLGGISARGTRKPSLVCSTPCQQSQRVILSPRINSHPKHKPLLQWPAQVPLLPKLGRFQPAEDGSCQQSGSGVTQWNQTNRTKPVLCKITANVYFGMCSIYIGLCSGRAPYPTDGSRRSPPIVRATTLEGRDGGQFRGLRLTAFERRCHQVHLFLPLIVDHQMITADVYAIYSVHGLNRQKDFINSNLTWQTVDQGRPWTEHLLSESFR